MYDKVKTLLRTFSLYLNDLETYFITCRKNGVIVETNTQQIYVFTKIFLLLHADDTVIVSEDPDDFQACLNSFIDYCDAWKLQINFSKTKIIVFGARNIANFCFYMGTTEIEIIKQYKYLGVIFSSSGSFLNARNINIL